jgi:hypothetical protein
MKKGAALLLLLLGAGFIAGLLHLFNLRFEAGDVYPPYSSLRADPLGTKAFYDSLDDLISTRRNFEPLRRLGDGRNTTLFYLGESPDNARFSTNEYRIFETFVRSGGRLVFAFSPSYAAPRANRFAKPGPATPPIVTPTNAPARRMRRQAAEFRDPGTVSIREYWHLDFDYAALKRNDDGSFAPGLASRKSETALPPQLDVHSALYFDNFGPDWEVHYARRDRTNEYAVLIERAVGGGSIVLAADSYSFSNEALRQARLPALLTWFVGRNDHVIFEETHLGTRNDPGIAAMARRYRLHGLMAALVILAGLFLWRSSVNFIPPTEEQLSGEQTHQVAGKDATEGFINLLRRNIPPVDILRICLEQWNAAAGTTRRPPAPKLAAMQKIIDEQNALEPRHRNPVRTYQMFCEILAQRT